MQFRNVQKRRDKSVKTGNLVGVLFFLEVLLATVRMYI